MGSQVHQTAFAVIAHLSVDYPDVEPIHRGVRLIMSRQQEKGEWLQEGAELQIHLLDSCIRRVREKYPHFV